MAQDTGNMPPFPALDESTISRTPGEDSTLRNQMALYGGLPSNQPGGLKFQDSYLSNRLGELHKMHTDSAKRHYSNIQNYYYTLDSGSNPQTGEALSDEEKQSYQNQLNGAWDDLLKTPGLDKDAKAELQARRDMMDQVLTHGRAKVAHTMMGMFPQPTPPDQTATTSTAPNPTDVPAGAAASPDFEAQSWGQGPPAAAAAPGIGNMPQLPGQMAPPSGQTGMPEGMLASGTVDVNHRPTVNNADGSHSTIFSFTVPTGNGQWALVPSIVDGKFLTPDGKKPNENDPQAMQQLEDAALDHYKKTSEHLGIFSSPEAADKFAEATHAYMPSGGAEHVFLPPSQQASASGTNMPPLPTAPAAPPAPTTSVPEASSRPPHVLPGDMLGPSISASLNAEAEHTKLMSDAKTRGDIADYVGGLTPTERREYMATSKWPTSASLKPQAMGRVEGPDIPPGSLSITGDPIKHDKNTYYTQWRFSDGQVLYAPAAQPEAEKATKLGDIVPYAASATGYGRKIYKANGDLLRIEAGAKPPAGEGSGESLSPDAVEALAENFIISHQLPALGIGGTALRVQVLNRAGQIAAGKGAPTTGVGGTLAGNKAALTALSASETQLQKNMAAVSAYENTSLKNLDLFLNTAKKVVDTGSPWISKPLQEVELSGLGDADQAAYNVARNVALNEIARVINNPNLTGVIAEDSKDAIMKLIAPGASLEQIYAAANILKQDMANRKGSLGEELDAIKTQIKGIGGMGNGSAQGGTPKVGDTKTFPNGKIGTWDGKGWLAK